MAVDPVFKPLIGGAMAVGVMAAVTLLSIAIITGYKDTGQVDNATADNFITGIAVFATFIGVIVLAIVGKAVMRIMATQ